MSSSVYTLDLRTSIAERQRIRELSWESDFEKNHRIFAENLADGIAKQVIKELQNTIRNPYKKLISSENRFISNISLEITRNSTAKEIIKFTNGSKELPPFNEWLERFSAEQKQSQELYFEEDSRDLDRRYFEDLMAIVGPIAENKLTEIFSKITSEAEPKNLQFQVKWFRSSDHLIGSSSDFRDNYLRIEFWFNEKAVIPTRIEEKSSGVIEQSRVKQKQLETSRTKLNVIVILIAAMIGLMILKYGPAPRNS